MIVYSQQVATQACKVGSGNPAGLPVTCAASVPRTGVTIQRYNSKGSAEGTLELIVRLERNTFSKALRLGPEGFSRKASQRNCLVLYAVQDSAPEQIAGYILCTASSLVLAINTVAVEPLHRRKGIATALIQEALRTSKAACATLHVDPRNDSALALYAKLGFVTDGVISDYYAHGCPARKLVKHLGASA